MGGAGDEIEDNCAFGGSTGLGAGGSTCLGFGCCCTGCCCTGFCWTGCLTASCAPGIRCALGAWLGFAVFGWLASGAARTSFLAEPGLAPQVGVGAGLEGRAGKSSTESECARLGGAGFLDAGCAGLGADAAIVEEYARGCLPVLDGVLAVAEEGASAG